MNGIILILSLVLIVAGVAAYMVQCKQMDEKKYFQKSCMKSKKVGMVASMIAVALGVVGVIVSLLVKGKGKKGKFRLRF